MTTLNWQPAMDHDAQFIGQCLRDDEATRLKDLTGQRATGQRAQLAFMGVHAGALGSAVINVGGTPVGMLCANPCTALGLRFAYLGLTPHADGIRDFDKHVMTAVSRHVQGDALGMVGSATLDDRVQARWYLALGFRPVPEAWAPACPIALFFNAQPGTQNLIEAYAASLNPANASRVAIH
jgi:hypothetical protein